MKLTDYAHNVYSQYGEDGIIEEICQRIGLEAGLCGEFGASDGLACSNTARLWKSGWKGFLIEADIGYNDALYANCTNTNCLYVIESVNPGNVDHLLEIGLYEHGLGSYDVLSIDIDGDDFWVFCSMKTRTKVLLIEYNRTIPPHLDLVPQLGNKMGIGSRTLIEAAEQRGYTFLGLTEGNCIFVDTEYRHRFADLETDLRVLQPPESFMYMGTDFEGRIIPLGHNPPWGLAWPPSSTQFRPNQDALLKVGSADSIERITRGIEETAAVAQEFSDLRSAAQQIALDMRGGYDEELRDRIELELRILRGAQDSSGADT